MRICLLFAVHYWFADEDFFVVGLFVRGDLIVETEDMSICRGITLVVMYLLPLEVYLKGSVGDVRGYMMSSPSISKDVARP